MAVIVQENTFLHGLAAGFHDVPSQDNPHGTDLSEPLAEAWERGRHYGYHTKILLDGQST